MQLTFATANDLFADYMAVLIWGIFLVITSLFILWATNKASPSGVRISSAAKFGSFAFLLLAVIAYQMHYGNFTQAEIETNGVKLHFADFRHSVALKREQISEVRYGLPGKSYSHSCYLIFVTKAGDTYRSATMEGTACKEYRSQIIALMQLAS